MDLNYVNSQLRSSGALGYAPLEKRTDPIAAALPRQSPPDQANGWPPPRGVRVTFIPEAGFSRSSVGASSQNSFGGLPVATDGFSASTLAAGGSLRFDFSGPLDLAADRRFVVVAGVHPNRTSSSSGPSIATSGLTSGFSAGGATFDLAAGYAFGQNYLIASGLFEAGHFTSQLNGASVASTRANGSSFDARAGHVFSLWTQGVSGSALLADGWKTVVLDMSAHVGVASQNIPGLVDAFGTVVGRSGVNGAFFGPSANLSALYKFGNMFLIPSAEAAIDFAPGQKTWSDPAFSTASGIVPSEVQGLNRVAPYFQAGVAVVAINGVSVSSNIYYSPGSTIKTVGGRISLGIPLL